MTSKERVMLKWLRAIVRFKPREVCYDEFAYKRMVAAYRKAARTAIREVAGGK